MDTGEIPEPNAGRASLQSLLEQSRPRGWRRFVRLGVILPVAIVCAGLGLWLYSSANGSDAARTFVVEQVKRGDLQIVVTATGSVQPVNQVEVSSEQSGTIRTVLVDYNSKVVKGQPLAQLDTDKLNAALQSARAKVASAKAQLLEANATVEEKRRDLARKRELASRQVAAAQDLDTAQAAYDRAVAERASAQAAIGVAEADARVAELNLSKACICSPIDGIVLNRAVDPGQTVASTLQAPVLFTIAEDLTRMEIQVDVDEADVGKVREGQSAIFRVDAYPDRKFDAIVRMIRFASETVQGVITYKAILDVDNKDALLRPGMTATAEIIVEHVIDAVLIPNAALRFSPPADPQQGSQQSLLSRLMPTRMPFRPAPRPDGEAGPKTVWQLRDNVLAPLSVTVGATDGRRTVVLGGGPEVGAGVIVDSVAAKR